MLVRFALTRVDSLGNRVLLLRNIATSHWDTKEEAIQALRSFQQQNSDSSLEVTPIDCWDTGESKRTVF